MSVNKVILIGRLGSDPELRYTQSQTPVCSFRVATSERRKGQDGDWKEFTEWHSVVVWGKTGENCNQYLKKGRQVFIEGRISTRKWQDKDGRDRYTTEVIANNVQFLGEKGQSGDIEVSRGEASRGSNSSADESYMSAAQSNQFSVGGGDAVSLDDDDIPF